MIEFCRTMYFTSVDFSIHFSFKSVYLTSNCSWWGWGNLVYWGFNHKSRYVQMRYWLVMLSHPSHKRIRLVIILWFNACSRTIDRNALNEIGHFFFPNLLGPLLKGLLVCCLGGTGQSLARCPGCWQLKQFPEKGLLMFISANCWVGAIKGMFGIGPIMWGGAHIGGGAHTDETTPDLFRILSASFLSVLDIPLEPPYFSLSCCKATEWDLLPMFSKR